MNPAFLNFVGFLSKQLTPSRPVKISVHGADFFAQSLDRIVAILFWKYSVLEAYERKLLASLLLPGMKVLDVGANIGYYTVQFSRLVGPSGVVISFEPDKNNFEFLKMNIEANHCNNVLPKCMAVSSKNGQSRLYFCEANRGDHHLSILSENSPSMLINTTSIDSVMKDFGFKVDLIKLDIQGGEYDALLGMEQVIKSNPQLIIAMEFSPGLLNRCGYTGQQLIDLILDQGFTIKLINEKLGLLEDVNIPHLVQRTSGREPVSLLLFKQIQGTLHKHVKP